MRSSQDGLGRADVMELVLGRHANDCACWRCVMRTDMQVRKHLAQMSGKMAYRRRSALMAKSRKLQEPQAPTARPNTLMRDVAHPDAGIF